MNAMLTIRRAGPGMSVQDLGRPGLSPMGLSRGGAADPTALHEAAALLSLTRPPAAVEMAGMGGVFEVSAPVRFALTGAPMRARIGTRALRWSASHVLNPGEALTIGPAEAGVYGYVAFAGGIGTAPFLGSRATHRGAGIGGLLADGERLPLLPDPSPYAPAQGLPGDKRFDGGEIRFIDGPQTGLFDAETLARFEATVFTRSATANRQGVRLDFDGAPFRADAPKGIVSDYILEGDLQMTGEGAPYALLCECQTIGGYPRMGTVLEADLPLVAQAPLGAPLRFRRVGLAEADEAAARHARRLKELRAQAKPLVRDPATIADLLSYQLISGVTAGDDLEDKTC